MKVGLISLFRRSRLFIACTFLAAIVVGTYQPVPVTLAVSTNVVISQVYGGGGNSGAPYTHDFVELFNLSSSPVNLSNWKVQYFSASGTSAANTVTLNATIQPGQYYLIQQGGGSTGVALPTPDAYGSANMSGTSGSVKLYDNSNNLVDMVGYGSPSSSNREGDAAPGLTNTTSAKRTNPCIDTDSNIDDFTSGPAAPRNSATPLAPCDPNATPTPVTPTPIPPTATPVVGDCAVAPAISLISEVQGSGETSPCNLQTVKVQAVVVSDNEGATPTLRGFYLQEEDADHDGNPLTSEGIFVYNYSNNNVSNGDLVEVTGQVSEYQGQTQITASTIQVLSSGNSVSPATITFPVESLTYLERYEGMLVEVPQTLYVSEHYLLGRFGELTLSANERLYQPTMLADPGPDSDAIQNANDLSRIILDDSTNDQNRDPIAFGRGGQPLSASNTIRGGDTITGLRGVLTYTWSGNSTSPNAYRIRPLDALGGGAPNFVASNPRPTSAPDVGGTVTVASFNVLNYFTTLVSQDSNARGADNAIEYDRQHAKLIQALKKINADVFGFMEIENSASNAPLQAIVDGLNAELGAGTYDLIRTGKIGTDAIAVAIIYKTETVEPVGNYELLDSSKHADFDQTKNRPMLTQTFREIATNETFTVAVNHLKSKGSTCSGDADPRQGNCNIVRTKAAKAIGEWLATNPTGDTSGRYLVIGDMNAYAKEDPIKQLEAAGFVNLVELFNGSKSYGYVYDGHWGYLDHALASADLVPFVTGTADYHINSDEPSILDYNLDYKSLGQQTSLYAADEYRTSDHDPVLIGLDLSAPQVTPTATATPSPTATEVTPTATPVTPTATEVTPTATEVTPSPTATQATPSPTATQATPSPTATQATPSPTATQATPSPTATQATPSPTATQAPPSATPATPNPTVATPTTPPSSENKIFLPFVGK
jgi:predicted extracellular nuclease